MKMKDLFTGVQLTDIFIRYSNFCIEDLTEHGLEIFEQLMYEELCC